MQPSSQRFTRATFLQCRCLVPHLALLRQKKRHVHSSQCTVSTILSINCADSSLTPPGFVDTEEEACSNRTVSTVPIAASPPGFVETKEEACSCPYFRQLEVVSTLPTLPYRTVLTVPYCSTKLVLPTVPTVPTVLHRTVLQNQLYQLYRLQHHHQGVPKFHHLAEMLTKEEACGYCS